MSWQAKTCPYCGGNELRPSSQGGLFRSLMRLIGRRPVRCRICDQVFWRFRPSMKATAGDPKGQRSHVIAAEIPAPQPIPAPVDPK